MLEVRKKKAAFTITLLRVALDKCSAFALHAAAVFTVQSLENLITHRKNSSVTEDFGLPMLLQPISRGVQ